jgi:hypothetical protein
MYIPENFRLPKDFIKEINLVFNKLHSVRNISRWLKKFNSLSRAIEKGNGKYRDIENHIFELKVINYIQKLNPNARITYEPPGKDQKGKNCDLLVEANQSYLVELKSFNPDTKSTPIPYQHITEGNELIMDGYSYHDRQSVQGHLIDVTYDTEDKIENYKDGYITILGVYIGFYLHIESLRDFITIYRTGKYRYDDGFGKMTVFNLKEKFKGTIKEFWGFPFEQVGFSLEHNKNVLHVSLKPSMDKEVNII